MSLTLKIHFLQTPPNTDEIVVLDYSHLFGTPLLGKLCSETAYHTGRDFLLVTFLLLHSFPLSFYRCETYIVYVFSLSMICSLFHSPSWAFLPKNLSNIYSLLASVSLGPKLTEWSKLSSHVKQWKIEDN